MAMTIRFDDDQAEALRTYAVRHHTSMQNVVLEAVDRYINDDTRRELVDETTARLTQRYAELLERLADA